MTFLPLYKLKVLQFILLQLSGFLVTEQSLQVERNFKPGAQRQYGMSQLRENHIVFVSVFVFVFESVIVFVSVFVTVFVSGFSFVFLYIFMQRNVRRGARRQYGMSQLRENPTGSFTANAESAQSRGLFGIP